MLKVVKYTNSIHMNYHTHDLVYTWTGDRHRSYIVDSSYFTQTALQNFAANAILRKCGKENKLFYPKCKDPDTIEMN